MALIRWSDRDLEPANTYDWLQRQINDLFQFPRFPEVQGLFDRRVSPALDVDSNELRITGRRPAEVTEGTYLVRERPEGAFYQAYTLDETIDRTRIDAALAGGVLTVTLHRREAEKPRRIAIK